MEVIAKVSIICRTRFCRNGDHYNGNHNRARYDDVTEKGNVPLYDLQQYEIKIRAIPHIRKWGIVKKINIRCKEFDASPTAHIFSLIQKRCNI